MPPDTGVGAVVINEVNASAKYIELYNPSEYECDLSGFRIRKNHDGFLQNADKSADFVIPQGTKQMQNMYVLFLKIQERISSRF